MLTYLERHGYDVKPSGPNRFVMLCPFHQEKTPSCMVPPPEGLVQTCHCFGCGETFDLFSFVEKTEGIPFMDAVEMFADELHIEWKDAERRSDATPRKLLREIVARTAEGMRKIYDKLDENKDAKRMVSKRGIPTGNAENHDLLGWAPEDDTKIPATLLRLGYKPSQLVEAGVARQWDDGSLHFPWHSRLMFTIRDLAGNPIAFTGRIVRDEDISKGKYVNSADNALFHKSDVLFCADIARKPANETKTVYVVEGQFDVLACQHAGRLNTVAASGTAFTASHAALLRRLVSPTGRIVFMFDADEAGQKAALRTFKATPGIQSQSYATIPVGDKDASDMYRDDPASLVRQLDDVHPLYHHVIDWLWSKADVKDEAGRRKFVAECLDAYTTIIDPMLQDNFLTYMSLKSGDDVMTLRALAGKARGKAKARKQGGDDATAATTEGTSDVIVDSGADDLRPEDYILALAAEQPQLRPKLASLRMTGAYAAVRDAIIAGDANAINADSAANAANNATTAGGSSHASNADGSPNARNDGIAGIQDATDIAKRLATATEMMRQFEGFSPLVDVDELFATQVRLLTEHQRDEAYARFHERNHHAITANTTADNVKAYEDRMKALSRKLDGILKERADVAGSKPAAAQPLREIIADRKHK